MLPVSAGFLPAIIRPHTTVSYVTAAGTDIPFTEFTVTVDSGSQSRRTLSLTVPGHEWIPDSPSSLLACNGQLVSASRGIRYVDGSEEIKPLGTFRIDSWSADPVAGTVSVEASSLECLLADDRFESPRTLTAASTQLTIRALCSESAPSTPFIVTATRDAPCPAYLAEEDRLGAIRDLATSIGAELRADAFGRFELRDIPTIANDPVWNIDAATITNGGQLVGSDIGASRDGVYNAVTARGENLGDDYPPVIGTAIDADPSSPTYYYGQFGKKRRFYDSPLLTTNAQAISAATSILATSTGAATTVSLDSVCNPALEDGDVITHEGVKYVVDSFSIGSGPDAGMTIATRSSKVPDETS